MPLNRIPILPTPRTEIWLTSKNQFLSIFLLVTGLAILVCAIAAFILGVAIIRPSPNSTQTPKTDLPTPSKMLTPTNQKVNIKTPTIRATTQLHTFTVTPRPSWTPTSDIWKNCNASYKSRLKVGEIAYVSNKPPLRNRLRTGPYISKQIIGYIDPGEQIEILEGPSCSNQWVWWRVKSLENSEIGWTSEGDSKNYWLVPIK